MLETMEEGTITTIYFFEILGQNATEPMDEIAEKIKLDFGSLKNLKTIFRKSNKTFRFRMGLVNR